MSAELSLRPASTDDLEDLLELEGRCFDGDRLSRRSFQRWLKHPEHRIFLVVEVEQKVLAYGLVLIHRGTWLARLYSIAVDTSLRGRGVGRMLMDALEAEAVRRDRLFMRLEVAKDNEAAIHLYQKLGYRVFGEWRDYYEDLGDALRMQKQIRHLDQQADMRKVPWYGQTAGFTCGSASLMMAMRSLREDVSLSQPTELQLWRESTTIFMTSGHGGCHPIGLALAAHRRGFPVRVVMSRLTPLFLEGVRTAHKKHIMRVVHEQFLSEAQAANLSVDQGAVTSQKMEKWLKKGCAVIALISSYRITGDKAPHWVVVTAMDDLCFYLHDPEVDKMGSGNLDCQHIPIAKAEFAKMLSYGRDRFSAVVLLTL